MTIDIQTGDQFVTYNLDELAQKHSGVITIGRRCDEVWNAIAINDASTDTFQCHIFGAAGGPWRLNNGQNRTECPKGLRSARLVPCNGCTGRCVNITSGRPKYYTRTPDSPTLFNGKQVGKWGETLNEGDKVTFGNTVIIVKA